MMKRARRVVAASASAEMPGFIKPQLATLKAKAPSGDQWLHEIKFDGYRVKVHLNKGKKRGVHPQRAGLDEALLRDRRSVGHRRPGDPRWRSGRHPRGSDEFLRTPGRT